MRGGGRSCTISGVLRQVGGERDEADVAQSVVCCGRWASVRGEAVAAQSVRSWGKWVSEVEAKAA